MATATRSTTRQVPPLELRAIVGSIDVEKRTVELIWTTGAPVLRGFYEPFYEVLSLDPKHVDMKRLNSGTAPLLNSHNGYDLGGVIGVVESAQLEAKRGTATVRFAKAEDDPEADQIFRKVVDKIIRNVSVGYRIHKMEKVEGGEGKIPTMRAVRWEPYEISMTAIGADAGAVTRSQATTNPCEFIEHHQERAMDPENPTPPPAPAPTLAPTPAPTPAAAPVPDAAAIRAAEQQRMLGIQRLGRALKRPDAEVTAAIAGGTSLEAFRAAATDAFADAETIVVDKRDPRVEPVADNRDKWLRGAAAWIMQRAGVSAIVAADAKQRGVTIDLDPGEFRGLRLIDLARQSLERAGESTKGLLSQELVGKAFTHRSGGVATTGDFPILLENVLNKVLLAQYMITPDTWRRFCRVGSVTDFKASKRYRPGTFGSLSALNEAGEFVSKSIPDGEKQSLTAATKGNIIGISRQAIINDDMGAFSTLATAFGRAAKLSVEVDVYALLALNAGLGPTMTDGLTLFHATHGNITTAAALAAAALDLDRIAMGVQRDPSGNEILELSPAILVVPKSLGGQARVINDSQYDPDTVANKAQMKANIAAKMFSDIVDTARIAATRRYLFADPGIAPTIEVAFLDGQEQPFMEMKEGWRVDGIEWKVREDYAVGAIDYRGAITNAG